MDIQASLGQRAGVGRYVRELLAHLGPEAGPDELSAFYFDFKRTGLESPPPRVDLRACRWMPGRVAQAAWKRFGFPPYDWFAGEADVYHFPNFIRPPLSRGRRSVVTIHDVSFLRMPETTEAKNLAWLSAEIHRTVERADAILTDSRFSAREIVELLGVPEGKVFPVWLGLPPFGPPPPPGEAAGLRSELGLEKPYLLMVGTLEPRKNLPFLVKVYEALKDFQGDLVIAGGLGWKTGPIQRAPLKRTEFQATAARSSSCGATSRKRACRAGSSKEPARPMAKTRRPRIVRGRRWEKVSRPRVEERSSAAVWARMTILLRASRSANAPAGREKSSSGSDPAQPKRPSQNGEPVIW